MSIMEKQCMPTQDALTDALLDSRQRWRDLVALVADLVFETDASGRLVYFQCAPKLGWTGATLIGQPPECLLAERGDSAQFNPFRPPETVRRRRAWLRAADGHRLCLQFSTMPMHDRHGGYIGARGLGEDVTQQDGDDASVAATLRRGTIIDHILSRMRQEVLAPRMMQAALEAMAQAAGAEGCAICDTLCDPPESGVLHQIGSGLPAVLDAAGAIFENVLMEPRAAVIADGRPLIVAPCETRFGEQASLLLWREPNGRAWEQDDVDLVVSACNVFRVILEHASIQREMARQARTDPLTGLLNRRAFLEEIGRRIERLEREGLPGTLMFVDLDNFKELNDRCGHDAGDDALRKMATLLRAGVRPADLVARLGGDEFAVWLDGADELASAERAESMRVQCPVMLADITTGGDLDITASIGIATRWPGRGEDIESIMSRADQVMYEVKRSGRGHWRVAQAS
jgi:diguanylate cyclase (GGDEF)-like protein